VDRPSGPHGASLVAVAVLAVVVLGVGACSSGSGGSGALASGAASSIDAAAGVETSSSTVAPSTAIGATAAALPSPGCSTPGPTPQVGTLVDVPLSGAGSVGQGARFVPSSYTGAPMPLVLDLHGYSEPYGFQPKLSGLPATAERAGFVYLAPQVDTAWTPFWNAAPQPAERDDLGFLRSVISGTEAQLCIDAGRVYVAGMSNGAFMSSLVACRMADEVVAIAPVAGFRFPDDCHPSRPVPIIAFHGTADPIVPFAGGPPGPATLNLTVDDNALRVFSGLTFEPLTTIAGEWAALEGCATPPTDEQATPTTRLLSYTGCDAGSAVQLYAIDGGGHSWPGTPFGKAIESLVGPTSTEVVADDLMWQFFSQYALPR